MEAVVFLFSLLDCCALIFLSVYFIITLSDLECDYINARSCCSKLNKWVIPEVIGHALVTVLMLVSLHWFIFLLNLPVATWNIYRIIFLTIHSYVCPISIKHTTKGLWKEPPTVLIREAEQWYPRKPRTGTTVNDPTVCQVGLPKFIMVPSGNMGVFDPTEIHNRGQLKSHMKEAMIKLGFYLLCFFMYLYSMILALIND